MTEGTQELQDYTINEVDVTTGHSVRSTIHLPPNAIVRDVQRNLYETRPYAWDTLEFFDGHKPLNLDVPVPHFVEMHKAPAPEVFVVVGSDHQCQSMGVYRRQDTLVDGRPYWKLEQTEQCSDDVQDRYLYWHEASQGWLIFQMLSMARCTMFLREDVRSPHMSQSKWTSWNGEQWCEDVNAQIFIDPAVKSPAPSALVITHTSLSAGIYDKLGTRNARPMYRKRDSTRSLYWSSRLQSWNIAEHCDEVKEEEATLYRLSQNVQCPTLSTRTWQAVAQNAGDGNLLKLWTPGQRVATQDVEQQKASQEPAEIPNTTIVCGLSSALFVQGLQSALRSGSAAYIPANEIDKLLRELTQSGLSASNDLETLMEPVVGQDQLKQQMRRIYSKIKFEQQTSSSDESQRVPHLALLGNSGTGKTTFAKILSSLFLSMELVKNDNVHVVRRADLIADVPDALGNLGRGSRSKVKAAVAMAKGGILLLDEAHELISLANGTDTSSSDDTRSIIDELMKVMDNSSFGVSVIIAGHPGEMEKLIETNAGLGDRLERLVFAEATVDELAKMLVQRMTTNGFTAAIDVTQNAMASLFNNIPPSTRSMYNGKLVQMFFEKASQNLALELRAKFGRQLDIIPESKRKTFKLEHLDVAEALNLQQSELSV